MIYKIHFVTQEERKRKELTRKASLLSVEDLDRIATMKRCQLMINTPVGQVPPQANPAAAAAGASSPATKVVAALPSAPAVGTGSSSSSSSVVAVAGSVAPKPVKP